MPPKKQKNKATNKKVSYNKEDIDKVEKGKQQVKDEVNEKKEIDFIESDEGERSANIKRQPTLFVTVDNVKGGFATQHIERILCLA